MGCHINKGKIHTKKKGGGFFFGDDTDEWISLDKDFFFGDPDIKHIFFGRGWATDFSGRLTYESIFSRRGHAQEFLEENRGLQTRIRLPL